MTSHYGVSAKEITMASSEVVTVDRPVLNNSQKGILLDACTHQSALQNLSDDGYLKQILKHIQNHLIVREEWLG